MMDVAAIDGLLRGIAIGGFAATTCALLVTPQRAPVRWIGAAFFLAAIAHTTDNSVAFRTWGTAFGPPVRLASIVAASLFWAFVIALFTDRATPWWRRLWPVALATVIGMTTLALTCPGGRVLAGANTVLSGVLVAHALLIIRRGMRDDLVASRRRLRTPVMAAAAAYVLLMAVNDLAGLFGAAFLPGPIPQAAALAALALLGTLALLRVEPDLVAAPVSGGPAQPPPEPVEQPRGLDAGDRLILARLEKAMDEDEAWRREDLTVGLLAGLVGAPEHRLRRLINGVLGHRNFAAFVNARRIEAAKAALADPERALKPVSTIAYDLGFGSLGPFNRAFKDAAGATPTAWRQIRLGAGASPNSTDAD